MDFDDWQFGPDAPPPPAPPTPERQPSPEQSPEMPLPPRRAPLAAVAAPRRSPTVARAKAGLGVIAAAAAAGAGAVAGGPIGGLAGLAAVGAIRNLYRSQGLASPDPSEKADAARSLALSVVGLAIVGYLGYRIYSSKDKS